ncbi:MAG: L,D-transpeptidase [Xanthobacteraceae bacterium]
MLLRLAAAIAAVLTAFSAGQAAAQYYPGPYYPPPPGVYYDPSPYPIAPPYEEESEESVIPPPYPPAAAPGLPPDNRTGLPYPATRDRSMPPAPDFASPDRAAPAPPYGHMPAPDAQRGGTVPAEGGPPRPPLAIGPEQQSIISLLPPEEQPEVGEPKELPAHLQRQLVDYRTKEPAGTIVIDTANTYLYFVLGNGQAMRYGLGVGREGFTWSGTERISRMAEWPDWHPPEEMIDRQPYLPRFMAGGESNPLGARALYLGKQLFRIHGTNQPSTIGQFVSSGCVRLLNKDIEDLYDRVKVGTRVVVLPGQPPATAQATPQQ